MRITNKIMQNNSIYNINNNKVNEDKYNTMMATGKKLTRPSDDPVIAIRALRLRSNVTQLSQYYEKNAKDAESWLEVTADALSTITSVLTDCVKQATKGANKDLTIDDLSIIVTQMDALSKEYYSTGNVDYAGRYIFTGFRTDTALTFDKTTTANYEDINDQFNASDVSTSSRVLNKHLMNSDTIMDETTTPVYEHQIVQRTVGRVRLSYDNLNYVYGDDNTAELKYREELVQPATSSVESKMDVLNLTYKTTDGVTRTVSVPINENNQYVVTSDGIEYKAFTNKNGNYTIAATEAGTGKLVGNFYVKPDGILDGDPLPKENIDSAITDLESKQVTTVTYTDTEGQKSVKLPILPAIGQTYELTLDQEGYSAVVHSDGTYTIKDNNSILNGDDSYTNTVINVTANGSIDSSYKETTVLLESDSIIYATSSEEEIDNFYEQLYNGEKAAVLNAATGEVLLNEKLRQKLATLPDIINAKSIDVVYDKKEWVNGDIKPEHLFSCAYTGDDNKVIYYNRGNAPHDIAYDVGFSQAVIVNTTPDEVYTTSVQRDVSDLSRMLNELKSVDSTLKTLNEKYSSAGTDALKDKIKLEINSAQKAYDYLRESIQEEFEHKITSNQKSLDRANIAVTENGARSKRLDLINQRLMNQTTTFKTLMSDNEDIDLAETATMLTTAQVTYEASLMATGKISQSSLMNYI